MTHLLIWLLAYPLVAAASTAIHAQATDTDPGRHNAGHAVVYFTGTLIILGMYYV